MRTCSGETSGCGRTESVYHGAPERSRRHFVVTSQSMHRRAPRRCAACPICPKQKEVQSQRLEPIVAERGKILNGRFYMDEGLLNQKTGIGPSGRYNQTARPSARDGHCEARETAETVGHLCERPNVPTKTSAVPTAVRRVEPRATTRTDVTLESLGPAVGVGAR